MPVTNWSSGGGTSVTLPPPSHPLVSLINSWPANNWNSFHTVDVQRIRQRKLGKQCHFVLKQCFCVSWLRLANYHNESCPERATGANINIPKVCFYEWANYTKKIESLSAAPLKPKALRSVFLEWSVSERRRPKSAFWGSRLWWWCNELHHSERWFLIFIHHNKLKSTEVS